MEEGKLLELLRQHDDDMTFTVDMQPPIPASRDPVDRRKYVTFVYTVSVGGTEKGVIEERYSRARRYHWRLVQLGLLECLQGGELSFPPMYWWRNMRDDSQNIRIRARQLQRYYTILLSNPEEMIPILEAATVHRVGDDGKIRARPPPRSLKSAIKGAEMSAQAAGATLGTEAEGKVATYPTADATDSDDDADEDGEALNSGMAFVSMPDGADEEAFFGSGEQGAGAAQWEGEWEDTFFDAGAVQLIGSFAGGGGDDYSTSRHVSDSVNAMSVLDNPNRFLTYNDSYGDDAGSAFAHLPDPDAGGVPFGSMTGASTDASTAVLPEPIE